MKTQLEANPPTLVMKQTQVTIQVQMKAGQVDKDNNFMTICSNSNF